MVAMVALSGRSCRQHSAARVTPFTFFSSSSSSPHSRKRGPSEGVSSPRSWPSSDCGGKSTCQRKSCRRHSVRCLPEACTARPDDHARLLCGSPRRSFRERPVRLTGPSTGHVGCLGRSGVTQVLRYPIVSPWSQWNRGTASFSFRSIRLPVARPSAGTNRHTGMVHAARPPRARPGPCQGAAFVPLLLCVAAAFSTACAMSPSARQQLA